jgi:Ion channel
MSRHRNLLERLRHPGSSNEHLLARLIVLVIATVVIDLVVSFAFYLIERGAPGTEITNYGDALFWTSSQITTVSSSLRNPITTGGRVLAVVTYFLAIAIVSILFGTIVDRMRTSTQP